MQKLKMSLNSQVHLHLLLMLRTLTPLTVNTLRVSWFSPPTPPGVTLYFNLTIFNLNSSSSEPVLMRTDIQTLHYNFTDNNMTRPCDVYSFQVTARNDVGIGNPSEIITGSLPSLPDISTVEDSLQHSLRVQFNVSSELVVKDVLPLHACRMPRHVQHTQ